MLIFSHSDDDAKERGQRMIPDERTCRYFMTIAQEKNISQAARRLYISQPSLSRFLSDLEKELGVSLFLRETGSLTLTSAGDSFCRYIEKLKDLEASFSDEIKHTPDLRKHRLTVGAGSITGPFLAGHVFPVFRREYPEIELHLVEDIHINLIARLSSGELDMALLVASGEDTLTGSHIKLLATAPRLFIISRSHPLSVLVEEPDKNSPDNPQFISPKCLENQSLIAGLPGQKVNDDINLLVKKYGIRSLSQINLQSNTTGLAMAECGMGIAFMPGFYITDPDSHPDLLYLYSDDPLTQWCMTIRHKNSRLSPYEHRFVELAKAVFSGKEPA